MTWIIISIENWNFENKQELKNEFNKFQKKIGNNIKRNTYQKSWISIKPIILGKRNKNENDPSRPGSNLNKSYKKKLGIEI